MAVEVPDGAVSEQAAHELYHEVVRLCMAEEGFVYVGPPYAVRGSSSTNVGYFRLASAAELGYGGVFEALRSTTPIGEPQDDLPFDQFDEYTTALRGTSDPEDGRIEGCYGEAEVLKLDLQVAGSGDISFGVFAEQILSSASYEEYNQEWSRCLLENGVEPRSGDSLQHVSLSRDFYYEQAFQVVAGYDYNSDLVQSLRNPPSEIDAVWLQDTTAQSADLDEILSRELQEATLDRDCRAGLSEYERLLFESE